MFGRNKMTNRQKIDASHEARLWIKDVIIPGVTSLVIIDRINPELKFRIKDSIDSKVNSIKKKFNKDDKFDF